jgi:capsular polysaccharide biosynthesis protein
VTGGWRRVVEDEVDYRPPRPRIHGDASRWDVLETRLPYVLPATRVVGLPGARVVGPHGWLVTPDDQVLVALTWYESFGTPSISKITWAAERYLPGSVLNLGTINGAINYGHFLLDGLGRLGVADQIGISAADFDWIVVPGFVSEGAKTVLRRLGLPPERIVIGQDGLALTGDLIVTPSLPGTTRVYRPVVADYLRTFAPPAGAADGSRVMISRRGGRRHLTNAEDVEGFAVSRGFRVVDPGEVDLAAELAGASVVMGTHGAALADLVFCRPGTHVVELIPSDHMFPYWFSLARAAGLDYSAVIGDSAAVRDPEVWGSSPYEFTVSLDALAEALDELE